MSRRASPRFPAGQTRRHSLYCLVNLPGFDSISMRVLVLFVMLAAVVGRSAAEITHVTLRVEGRIVELPKHALYDGREAFLPLEALAAFGAQYTFGPRQATAHVPLPGGKRHEIALARPGREPMLPAADLARALGAKLRIEKGICDIAVGPLPPAVHTAPPPGQAGQAPAPSSPVKPASPPAPTPPRPRAEPPRESTPPSQAAQPPRPAPAVQQPEQVERKPQTPAEDTTPPTPAAAEVGVTRLVPAPESLTRWVALREVRFESMDEGRAQVRLVTSGRVAPTVTFLTDPGRLVVEVPNCYPEMPEETWRVDHPLVSAIRVIPGTRPGALRVELKLERLVAYAVSPAAADGFLVNLRLPRGAGRRIQDMVVVVDPGHGGSQGGCRVVVNGTCIYEKDITLAIARKLSGILQQAGAQVIMTRNEDKDVPLAARPALATKHNADLFVSVHVDWWKSAATSGSTAYYHRSDESSRALAHSIINRIRQVSGIPSKGALSDGVLYAGGLAVLRRSTVPAVLVEVGYLSNPRDRSNIMSDQWRTRVAQAIFEGIRGYAQAELPDPPAAAAALE